jgi:hypothetical protein
VRAYSNGALALLVMATILVIIALDGSQRGIHPSEMMMQNSLLFGAKTSSKGKFANRFSSEEI